MIKRLNSFIDNLLHTGPLPTLEGLGKELSEWEKIEIPRPSSEKDSKKFRKMAKEFRFINEGLQKALKSYKIETKDDIEKLNPNQQYRLVKKIENVAYERIPTFLDMRPESRPFVVGYRAQGLGAIIEYLWRIGIKYRWMRKESKNPEYAQSSKEYLEKESKSLISYLQIVDETLRKTEKTHPRFYLKQSFDENLRALTYTLSKDREFLSKKSDVYKPTLIIILLSISLLYLFSPKISSYMIYTSSSNGISLSIFAVLLLISIILIYKKFRKK